MSWWFSMFCCACFMRLAWRYWSHLDEERHQHSRRAYWIWAARGLGLPILWWTVFNCGILPRLPTLLPDIEAAKFGGGPWFGVFLDHTWNALFVISSCWAGMTFMLLACGIFEGILKDHRRDFLGLALFWSAVMLPLAGLIVGWLGWTAIGLGLIVWLAPITSATLPLVGIKPRLPTYSRAATKMWFGKYADAEWEVLRELEKCEDDFAGWLLLAELYALHFHDLVVAEQTIHDLCDQPNVNGSQIAVALNLLADWHLKVADDPVAARRALEEICRRLPDTHVARMARQRLNQLPATREALLEQRMGKPIHLAAPSRSLDESALAPAPEMTQDQAAALANQYVEKLKKDPNDVPARESLARVLAERLDKIDLALEQMELLLSMRDPTSQKKAEWLALMAAWQIKDRRDPETIRKSLERIIHEYPQSPQAFAAQKRLSVMEVELKFRKARAAAGYSGKTGGVTDEDRGLGH